MASGLLKTAIRAYEMLPVRRACPNRYAREFLVTANRDYGAQTIAGYKKLPQINQRHPTVPNKVVVKVEFFPIGESWNREDFEWQVIVEYGDE